MKSIIINNTLYNQTQALKLLGISKSYYYTLKENTGFELKHLTKYSLKGVKRSLLINKKSWNVIKTDFKKWVSKINKIYNLKLKVKDADKLIREHNRTVKNYRADGFQALTRANVINNKSVYKNIERFTKPRDFFSVKANRFEYNFKREVANHLGPQVAEQLNELTRVELIDFAVDSLKCQHFVDIYVIDPTLFLRELDVYKMYLQERREKVGNAPENEAHIIFPYSEWIEQHMELLGDLEPLVATNPLETT